MFVLSWIKLSFHFLPTSSPFHFAWASTARLHLASQGDNFFRPPFTLLVTYSCPYASWDFSLFILTNYFLSHPSFSVKGTSFIHYLKLSCLCFANCLFPWKQFYHLLLSPYSVGWAPTTCVWVTKSLPSFLSKVTLCVCMYFWISLEIPITLKFCIHLKYKVFLRVHTQTNKKLKTRTISLSIHCWTSICSTYLY